jgi:RNA polymerase sigma factor (sigma-70 family)
VPSRAGTDAQQDTLEELAPIVRRVIAAKVRDPDIVDDLVQETLTRLVEAWPRLNQDAVTAYAVVTARNLVASLARRKATEDRHAHRLLDLRDPVEPEEEAIRQEDRDAVATALDKLSNRERGAVVAHEVAGKDTATLAQEMGSSQGGVAVQLARARAKLRVDYLMALRKGSPPTSRCRSVLIALSAGDRRRQAALDVSSHLLDCEHCAALSEALIHRRRGLAVLLPLGMIAQARNFLARHLQTATGQVAAVGVAVATAGVVVLAVASSGTPTTSGGPTTTEELTTTEGPTALGESTTKVGSLSVRGKLVAPWEVAGTDRFAGLEVKASGSVVRSVPADEGFWIGGTGDNRVWVQLMGRSESPMDVTAGRRVSFSGRIVKHSLSFVRRVGIETSESAGLLRQQQHHIVVREESLRIT